MTVRDRTAEAVAKQLEAMRCDAFEVGVYNAEKEMMLIKNWDKATVLRSISYLKYENMQGRHIYVRPRAEYMAQLSNGENPTEADVKLQQDPLKATHCLTLVDDLSKTVVEQMKKDGFNPALITETSPGNFQAWVNHGKTLPAALSTEAARNLAKKYGGDLGSADWRRFGRLAGFTNCKPKHKLENGRFPFVMLQESTGVQYPNATEFLATTEKIIADRIAEEKQRRESFKDYQPIQGIAKKGIHDFRNDPRYKGDYHRADLGYATYALSRGIGSNEIDAAIRSRDLSHKGSTASQQAYIDRTIAKAQENILGNSLHRTPSKGLV